MTVCVFACVRVWEHSTSQEAEVMQETGFYYISEWQIAMDINFCLFFNTQANLYGQSLGRWKPNKIILYTYFTIHTVVSSLAKAICIMQEGIAIHIVQLITVDMK